MRGICTHEVYLFLVCLPISPISHLNSPVRETLTGHAKLSELVSDHLLRDRYREVILAIVDHEAQSDKVWENGACARFCVDWLVLSGGFLQ